MTTGKTAGSASSAVSPSPLLLKLKTCTVCAAVKSRTEFYKCGNGVQSSCKPCSRARNGKWMREHKNEYKAYKVKHRTTLGGRAQSLLGHARKRSKELNLPMNLTREHLEALLAPGVCMATGLPLDFTAGIGRTPYSPSIDRIHPQLGYVVGNVQITTWQFNAAKLEFPLTDLLVMATALVAKQGLVNYDEADRFPKRVDPKVVSVGSSKSVRQWDKASSPRVPPPRRKRQSLS